MGTVVSHFGVIITMVVTTTEKILQLPWLKTQLNGHKVARNNVNSKKFFIYKAKNEQI